MDAPQYESSDVPWGEPSPEEIAERTAAIRATWDEKTHQERRVWNGHRPYKVPFVRFRDCEPIDADGGMGPSWAS